MKKRKPTARRAVAKPKSVRRPKVPTHEVFLGLIGTNDEEVFWPGYTRQAFRIPHQGDWKSPIDITFPAAGERAMSWVAAVGVFRYAQRGSSIVMGPLGASLSITSGITVAFHKGALTIAANAIRVIDDHLCGCAAKAA